MPATEVFVPTSRELQPVFESAVDQFLTPMYTNELAEASMVAFIGGKEGAYFVPAVDFAVGVGLRACNVPAIRKRMPQEVAHRADIAAYVAGRAAKIGAESGLFVRAYRANPYLSEFIDPVSVKELSDAYQMQSLCEPPFLDVAIAIGGAVRALGKSGVNGERATSAINSSHSLRLIAHVRTTDMRQVHRHLGTPYAREHHYAAQVQDEHVSVDFHQRTIAYLRERTDKESGCPAMSVRPGQGRTVFSDRWRDISRLLLAEGAEASANLPFPVRRRIARAAA